MRRRLRFHKMRARLRAWGWAGCWVVAAQLPGEAAEWTQYRGPNHDGVSTERINPLWTGTVTNPVWRVFLTNGLTSLTVAGGRVFTQVAGDLDADGLAHKEFCVALSATNGAWLWATEVEARPLPNYLYPNGGVGLDDGPRSTPVVVDGSVYVLSSYLKLYRLDASNGAIIWSTNLVAGFGGYVIPWQNAASPVVENGLVFVNANAGTQRLMAFNTTNGALVWRAHNEGMTHATPVLATIHGVRQLIFATQSGLIGLNPQTGALLWRTNHPFTYSTSLAASPVVHGDMIFVSGAYNMGSAVTRVLWTNNAWSPRLLWYSNALQSHWMTPVGHDGFLYGPFGSASRTSPLRCIEMATGTIKWSTNNFGLGSVVRVNHQILGLTEHGILVLFQANPNAYTEVARFTAIPGYHSDTNKCWNAMALSDGQLYVRSTAFAARYDLSRPDLLLDPPQPAPGNKVNLTIRAAGGAPILSNRLAAMQVRAAPHLDVSAALWAGLTNPLVFSNGLVLVTNVDAPPPRRFFMVAEPQ